MNLGISKWNIIVKKVAKPFFALPLQIQKWISPSRPRAPVLILVHQLDWCLFGFLLQLVSMLQLLQ